MKKVYVEQKRTHVALSRNKFCTCCGEHEYTVVEQLEPLNLFPWSVRCEVCGYETHQYSIKRGAMKAWMSAGVNENGKY